jgi:hypothetical protein
MKPCPHLWDRFWKKKFPATEVDGQIYRLVTKWLSAFSSRVNRDNRLVSPGVSYPRLAGHAVPPPTVEKLRRAAVLVIPPSGSGMLTGRDVLFALVPRWEALALRGVQPALAVPVTEINCKADY